MVQRLRLLIQEDVEDLFIDIRKPSEWEEGIIKGARTLFLGELKRSINEFGKQQIVVPYCSSGKRATIAASLFESKGFEYIKVS